MNTKKHSEDERIYLYVEAMLKHGFRRANIATDSGETASLILLGWRWNKKNQLVRTEAVIQDSGEEFKE